MKERNDESKQMYLEAIYVLSKQNDKVRGVDIARYLGFSRPTISERLPKLQSEGLVKRSGTEVLLTDKGKREAEHVYERHVVLSGFFKGLGVRPDVATEDACRVEHYISDETFDAIKTYYHASGLDGSAHDDDGTLLRDAARKAARAAAEERAERPASDAEAAHREPAVQGA